MSPSLRVRSLRRVASPWLVLTLFIAACDFPLRPPDLPDGAVPLDPPAHFADLWAEVQACSGQTRIPGGIDWFTIPHVRWFEYQGGAYDGMWWENRWILLAGQHVNDAQVVRHEMLHDILDTVHHPREYFVEKCGHLLRPR